MPGYYRILDALAHPDADENRGTLEWLGKYKPEAFRLASARMGIDSLFTRV